MRENLTEIVFILDRSGSMSQLESDTIGGFNSMIAKQKKKEGEAIVSTVLFDDEIDVIHDRVPIRDVKELTDEDHYVGGYTALLDAIGISIHHINDVHKQLEDNKVSKTLFIITTDGMENASRYFSFRTIKTLIRHQKEHYNWEFLFLGANIDAIGMAEKMGISQDYAANYHCDEIGMSLNYEVLEEAVTRVRNCKTEEISKVFSDGEWKKDIDHDYKKRGRNNLISD